MARQHEIEGRLEAEAQLQHGARYLGPLVAGKERGYHHGTEAWIDFRAGFMQRKAEITLGRDIVTDTRGRVLALA